MPSTWKIWSFFVCKHCTLHWLKLVVKSVWCKSIKIIAGLNAWERCRMHGDKTDSSSWSSSNMKVIHRSNVQGCRYFESLMECLHASLIDSLINTRAIFLVNNNRTFDSYTRPCFLIPPTSKTWITKKRLVVEYSGWSHFKAYSVADILVMVCIGLKN